MLSTQQEDHIQNSLMSESDGARLAAFVTNLCDKVELSSFQDGIRLSPPPSPFRLPHEAPIPLSDFTKRLAKYFYCSSSCGAVAAVLMVRVHALRPDLFDARSAHKILLAALTIAAKFSEDAVCHQKHYAQCGGIEVSEMNVLELTFLELLNFNAFVHAHEMQLADMALARQFGSLCRASSHRSM